MTNDSVFAATFDAREVAAAVKAVGKMLERRNSIPILSTVLIQLGDDAATITGTDLDNWLSVIVPAVVPIAARGAMVTVDPSSLGMILAKADKGAIAELRYFGGKLGVSAGRARSNLATLPADDFPLTGGDVLQSGPCFTMPAATFAHDLARLSPAMSTEETRYYLNGVHVTRDDAGRLDMAATDGNSAVFIVRDAVAMPDAWAPTIIARKSVATVLRILGKKPAGDVTVSLDGSRVDVCGDGFWLSAKAVDGTFPDVRGAVAAALGDELQSCAFPDAEPRLNTAQLSGLAKPCGAAFDVVIGEKGASLSYAGAPEYLGFVMLYRDGYAGGAKGYDYERGAGFERKAVPYLVELARSRGFDVACYFAPETRDTPRYRPLQDIEKRDCFRLHLGAGCEVVGATFGGIARSEDARTIEEPDFETLTMRKVTIPAVREYEEGAFSVAMPRERRLAYAAVTIGEGDEERAIRTNAKGEIELTAAQVRAMAGPVDTSAHVAIPAGRFYLGAILPDGWALPLPLKRKASGGYAVVTDAALLPLWTGAGARDWRADRAVGLLVPDVGDWNWIDHCAARVAAECAADAEPVATVASEALGSPVSVANADAPSSVAEVDERADVPASPAPARVCPVVPSPKSPFAVAAVDDGPDMAALVAELAQRVAALEAERASPASVAGTSADYAAPGDDRRSAWEAELAARAGVALKAAEDDAREAGETIERLKRKAYVAGVDADAKLRAVEQKLATSRGELARVEAERDALQAECDFLQAARTRTAATLLDARRTIADWRSKAGRREDQRLLAKRDSDEARAALAVVERNAARLRSLAPLAGIQWGGGHLGATVMPGAPVRPAAPPARLIVANGRRVAA